MNGTGLFHVLPAWLLFVVLYISGCEEIDWTSVPVLSLSVTALSTFGTSVSATPLYMKTLCFDHCSQCRLVCPDLNADKMRTKTAAVGLQYRVMLAVVFDCRQSTVDSQPFRPETRANINGRHLPGCVGSCRLVTAVMSAV